MPRRPPPYWPDYGPCLPTSGPDWCWSRACEIVSGGMHASVKRDGPDIVRAIKFIRAANKACTERAAKTLLKMDPSLAMALQFRRESGRRQLELHCRVLAGESAGAIAVELGLTRDVVETYCLYFFDVSERLAQTDYIYWRVIHLPPIGPVPVETLMKLVAYKRGPIVIGAWLDYLDHQGEMHDITTPEGRRRESIELFVKVRQLPADEKTAVTLAKNADLLFEKQPEMFLSCTADGVITRNAHRLMAETLWDVPSEASNPDTSSAENPTILRLWGEDRASA